MVFEETEERVESLLKFRLLMAEHTQEDPVLEGHMLVKLMLAYEDNEMKIPKQINDFIRDESIRICDFIQRAIRIKQAKQAELEKKRDALVAQQKEELITFNAESVAQMRKLSRNEEIWGAEQDL